MKNRPSLRSRLAALAALAGVVAAGPAPAEPDTWHAEAISTSPHGLHVTQYWSKGRDKLRAETVIAGHRLLTLVNGDTYYTLDLVTGKAVAIERSAKARKDDGTFPRPFAREGWVIDRRGGEKVSEEPLAGSMCDVWRHTTPHGRRVVWVRQEEAQDRIPLRSEVYDRNSTATVKTDYVQWAAGMDLADRFFEPDPRLEVVRMGYDEYLKRSGDGDIGIPPVLHANLLHGSK